MTSTIKPVSFARGVPAEPKNGFYGIEKQLLEHPADSITVVATYKVEDIIDKELSGERYPIVAIDHIEVLHDAQAIEVARRLQLDAHHQRTAGDQLDVDFPETLHEPALDLDSELADRDPGEDDAAVYEEGDSVIRIADRVTGFISDAPVENGDGVLEYPIAWDDDTEGTYPTSAFGPIAGEGN